MVPTPPVHRPPPGLLTSRRRAGKMVRMGLFKKKKLADFVIFLGLAVNAVVIVLILYFYLF